MIIKTYDLSKKFGNNIAVDSVNMEIDEGQVYGFVGMNGAGKSTTIKLLTGLLKPTSGSIELFGKSGKKDLQEMRKMISGYVDAPAFYLSMTAMDNLSIFSKLYSAKKNRKEILDVVKLVHLDDAGNKKVSQFSLGMKQRLAIGCALLASPRVIILDEPINGLDPGGIVEIRDIIKKLSMNYGTTFLISSHILSELEKIATNYGVISKGKLIEQISKEVLQNKLEHYVIECKACNKVYEALKAQNCDCEVIEGRVRIRTKNLEAIKNVLEELGEGGSTIRQEMQDLESYFFDLVGGKNNESSIQF